MVTKYTTPNGVSNTMLEDISIQMHAYLDGELTATEEKDLLETMEHDAALLDLFEQIIQMREEGEQMHEVMHEAMREELHAALGAALQIDLDKLDKLDKLDENDALPAFTEDDLQSFSAWMDGEDVAADSVRSLFAQAQRQTGIQAEKSWQQLTDTVEAVESVRTSVQTWASEQHVNPEALWKNIVPHWNAFEDAHESLSAVLDDEDIVESISSHPEIHSILAEFAVASDLTGEWLRAWSARQKVDGDKIWSRISSELGFVTAAVETVETINTVETVETVETIEAEAKPAEIIEFPAPVVQETKPVHDDKPVQPSTGSVGGEVISLADRRRKMGRVFSWAMGAAAAAAAVVIGLQNIDTNNGKNPVDGGVNIAKVDPNGVGNTGNGDGKNTDPDAWKTAFLEEGMRTLGIEDTSNTNNPDAANNAMNNSNASGVAETFLPDNSATKVESLQASSKTAIVYSTTASNITVIWVPEEVGADGQGT